MPVRATDCWLLATSLLLSVISKVVVRVPVPVGAKVTLMVQLLPTATELPQVLVSAKSPELPPVGAMLLIAKGALPWLVRVTVCAALVVPRVWLGKVRLLTVRLTTGAPPVPVRLMV